MRSTLSALLLSMLLVPSPSWAQRCSFPPPTAGAATSPACEATFISLLQQSHDVAQQLPTEDRLYFLSQQLRMVSPFSVDLAREWATELFTLASQVKCNKRYYTQVALGNLARVDPDRVLEVLHRLNLEEANTNGLSSRPNMSAVRRVYEFLVERDGARALPLIEQESARLGLQGHYPYAALGYAAMQLVTKDWGSDNQHAISVLLSVFDRAFERYRRDSRNYFTDLEFGDMLEVLSGGLPADSVRPALKLLVDNLLTTDTSKYSSDIRVYTKDGRIVRADNAIDAALLHFGDLIYRVDPDLASHLAAIRPELQTALELTKDGQRQSEFFGFGGQGRRATDSDADIAVDAIRLSHTNAEAAIAKAQELPDNAKRNTALLDVARGVTPSDPEKAARLIAEVQGAELAPDREMQLNLISAQAAVAAREGSKGELHQLIQQAFALAGQILLERPKTNSLNSAPGFGHLTQIAMQSDPDLIVSFIQSVPPSVFKADLLMGAAAALQLPNFVSSAPPTNEGHL